MSSLASKIESLSLTSPPSPPQQQQQQQSTHLCWTLSLVNPLDNEAEKIAGCRCSGLKCIEKKEMEKKIVDNFMKKGQLCLEGKDKKVYVMASGDIMFKNGNDFVPVMDAAAGPANIREEVKICLCDGCQDMSLGCAGDYDIGGILSFGVDGLYFYINTTV